jgi:UPF0755 protein
MLSSNLKLLTKYSYVIIFLAGSFISCGEPAGENNTILFEVEKGWGASKVTSELLGKKIISGKLSFRIYLFLSGSSDCIKTGSYKFSIGQAYSEISDILCSGNSVSVDITIPEGYNNRQIGDLLTEKGYSKSREEFLALSKDKVLLEKYAIPAETIEGYLFPETYKVPVDFSLLQITEVMLKKMQDVLNDQVNTKLTGSELHRKMILASIVEREAQRKEERTTIAGVFQNRLNRSIPLESCATVQYLFEKPKARLLYKDLEIKSPYNTYINPGLPPAPISNPGFQALRAAFNPENTEYLYFVLKGDGYHYFSKTFKEHLAAKKKYIGP